MASGLASRGPYDEEAAVRRPLEFDGRDACVSASSSSDYLPGKLYGAHTGEWSCLIARDSVSELGNLVLPLDFVR
jgi:hypothetical protein